MAKPNEKTHSEEVVVELSNAREFLEACLDSDSRAAELIKPYRIVAFEEVPRFLFEVPISVAEAVILDENPEELISAFEAIRNRGAPLEVQEASRWASRELRRADLGEKLRGALQKIAASCDSEQTHQTEPDVMRSTQSVRPLQESVELVARDDVGLPTSILAGDSTSDSGFLACHVRNDDPTSAFHLFEAVPDVFKLDLQTKIKLETAYWVNELLKLWEASNTGESAGQRRTHRHMPRSSIARTIRVLKALELLLLDFETRESDIWRTHTCWENEYLRVILSWSADGEDPSLNQSAPFVQRSVAGSFSPDLDWGLSWPLLTVRAAAWCLIAWEQPILWEAHSALKAEQDHRVGRQMSDDEIKCLAYLIRFQSAPGQFARRTGDDRFFDRASELGFENLQFEYPGIDRDLVIALGVLAHAQDFRNRPLDIEVDSDLLNRILLEEGYVNKVASPTRFDRFWDEFSARFLGGESRSERESPGKTWSYSDFFLRDDDSKQGQRQILRKFRKFAESRIEEHITRRSGDRQFSDLNIDEIAGYSFGRDFMNAPELQRAMTRGIREVAKRADRFDELFRFEPVYVPDCFDSQRREAVILVRLVDDVTAHHMVYSQSAEAMLDSDEEHPAWPLCRSFVRQAHAADYIPGIKPESKPKHKADAFYHELFGLKRKQVARRTDDRDVFRAWRLFEYLFLEGIVSGMIRWAKTRPSENYCPTYLIGSILDTCYRIAPDCCLSFPIEIDGESAASIRLPIIPEGAAVDAPAVKAVARYVGACAVNKLMARRVESIRVGLRNLEKGPADSEKSTAGRFWREVIRNEYAANALEKFLGYYADNYLQLVDHVQFDEEAYPVPEFVHPESANPTDDLESLLETRGGGDVVLAGVDVGGTYTKFSLYSLSRSDEGVDLRRWQEFPESFRIETAIKDETYNGATPFCERLLTEMERQLKTAGHSLAHIDALGITWPGPVRDNRICEWSGILKRFRNTRGEMFGTDLRELMRLDIAGAMENLFRRRTARTVPIAMINDGDSHAIGEIYRMLIHRRLDAGLFQGTSALLKAGTGTAGAVARNGRLIGGLMEFGKLIVNLAYEPNATYPEGLANRFCSAKTLPALACAQRTYLSNLDPALTSIEVGLLAGLAGIAKKLSDAHESKDASVEDTGRKFQQQFQELLIESGKVAFAAKLPDTIDAAELGNLLDGKWAERPESRITLESVLGRVGKEAFDKLCERVRRHGIIRLEAILQLEAATRAFKNLKAVQMRDSRDDVDTLNRAVLGNTAPGSPVVKKIAAVAGDAQKCVERLGEFLGDMSALLYSEHRMERMVFGGGVLSGQTGYVAISKAAERMNRFSRFERPHFDPNRTTIHFASIPEPIPVEIPGSADSTLAMETGDSGEPIDPGTYGVAVQAAVRLLLQRRSAGLDSIRALVEGLTLTHQLVVDRDEGIVSVETGMGVKVKRSGKSPSPITLRHFALDGELVREYLDRHGQDLGIIRSPSSNDRERRKVTTYTRWTRR